MCTDLSASDDVWAVGAYIPDSKSDCGTDESGNDSTHDDMIWSPKNILGYHHHQHQNHQHQHHQHKHQHTDNRKITNINTTTIFDMTNIVTTTNTNTIKHMHTNNSTTLDIHTDAWLQHTNPFTPANGHEIKTVTLIWETADGDRV